MSAITLPDVVEAVYDSIADAGRWPSTLQSICQIADGCLATLGVVDTATSDARFLASWGDAGVLSALVIGHGENNPFYTAIPKMQFDVPYTVDSLYDIQGPSARETWLESRIAKEWVIPNNLDDFFWVSLMKQPARAGNLVIVTHKNRRAITAADLDVVSLLAPHVRRAVMIGDLFAAEQRKAAMFRAVIEELVSPVLIVGRGMEIIFANRAAEDLLIEGTAIASTSGRLSFTYAPARAAVARAVEIGMKDELALGPSGINVPLVRAHAPAVAHVMPLARRDPSARFAEHAAAAIFIGLAGNAPLPAMEAIAALFGFTAAETRVAGQVAVGLNRHDIALAGGVSQTTVQTQLGAIFEKTGTGDQRALEFLIRELSPPVRNSGRD